MLNSFFGIGDSFGSTARGFAGRTSLNFAGEIDKLFCWKVGFRTGKALGVGEALGVGKALGVGETFGVDETFNTGGAFGVGEVLR